MRGAADRKEWKMAKRLKDWTTHRNAMEVGPGDYVKIGTRWERIASNTAHGSKSLPRSWSVSTENGRSYGMFEIMRYARAEDMENI
jgi:hypothetical protein